MAAEMQTLANLVSWRMRVHGVVLAWWLFAHQN
jgi:hypothetical protein